MMAMGFMEVLLLLLGGGGGNDLLDYLPTQAYWKAKGVEVTVERMAQELTTAEPADLDTLVRDLGADDFQKREDATRKLVAIGPAAKAALERAAQSDDPEVRTRARQVLQRLAAGGKAQAVRRLMALRALGELKQAEALPALRALLTSKEPFVADYARQAIATIEGKPYQRPEPDRKALWKDVCLLPPGCALVAQMTMPPGGPVAFDEILKQGGPMLHPGMDPQQMLDQVVKMLSMAAERVGNIRVHGATVGVSGEVGDNAGFAVVVVRGLYDAEAVKAALRDAQVAMREVDGVAVMAPEREAQLIPCSNDRFVIAAGPRQEFIPVKEVIAAVKRDGDTPALDAGMLELIKAADTSASAWGVVQMTDTYRQVRIFAPFDTAVLTSRKAEEGATALTLVARGQDAAAVGASADELKTGLEKAKAEMTPALERMPGLKPIAEFLDSVGVKAEGATVTLTATVKGMTPAMMMPMMIFGARAGPVARPQPPPQVQEAQPAEF